MNCDADLRRQFDRLLLPYTGVRTAAADKFGAFHEAVLEATGECTDAFNQILKGGPFSQDSSCADSLPTIAASCRDVLLTSATLAEVYQHKALHPTTGAWGQSGWAGLNLDAKRWCRKMLTAQPPPEASGEELREILTAKSIVGLMAAAGIPESPRSVQLLPVDKSTISQTEIPLDE